MGITNPNNGYIPKVGERVRIVGGCHPRALNKVVEVTKVYEEDGRWWFEEWHYSDNSHSKGEVVSSGGVVGGLEPAEGEAVSQF